MREVFAQGLHWHEPAQVRACAIERVRYRPGRSCVIGYRLTLDGADASMREQRVSASVFAADEAHARYRAELDAPRAPHSRYQCGRLETLLPPMSFIAPLHMLVRAFPCDRKLESLPLLADPGIVARRFLPALVAAHWGKGASIVDANQGVVSYFPEHTCTVRVDVGVVDGSSRRDWCVYGKVRYDDAGATTFGHMHRLWRSSSRSRANVGFARPLHYDAELCLLWQEAVEGVPLALLLEAGLVTRDVLADTGSALAALHGSGVVPARTSGMDHVLDNARKAASVVAGAVPECASAAHGVLDGLLRAIPEVGDQGTLHGDLHSNNVVVAHRRIALIDIDRLAHGPVLADLGSMLAELAMRDCVRGRRVDRDRLLILAGAYAAARGRAIDERALAWHCAAAMLGERAMRSVTSLKPGRLEALPALLDAAATLLHKSVPADPAGPVRL